MHFRMLRPVWRRITLYSSRRNHPLQRAVGHHPIQMGDAEATRSASLNQTLSTTERGRCAVPKESSWNPRRVELITGRHHKRTHLLQECQGERGLPRLRSTLRAEPPMTRMGPVSRPLKTLKGTRGFWRATHSQRAHQQ